VTSSSKTRVTVTCHGEMSVRVGARFPHTRGMVPQMGHPMWEIKPGESCDFWVGPDQAIVVEADE